jgi:predicted phosphoribosyltransferase
MRFRDRRDAGSMLATALEAVDLGPDTVVLGVPRGGVVVAAEVADALGLPLDLALARKIGAPGHAELAIGAIGEDGAVWLNQPLMDRLRIDREWLDAAIERERAELARRSRRYRGDAPPLPLAGRTAVVVDDGVATGATLAAVLAAVRVRRPVRLVAAVPVAPPEAVATLTERCDTVVCPVTPARFDAVGAWYRDFGQTTDAEVVAALAGTRGSGRKGEETGEDP